MVHYLLLFFFLIFIHLFIWLHWVLVAVCRIFVAVCGIFSCGMWDLFSGGMWDIFSGGMWDLVPWPGIEPGLPALGMQSLNHWTTREVPILPSYKEAYLHLTYWSESKSGSNQWIKFILIIKKKLKYTQIYRKVANTVQITFFLNHWRVSCQPYDAPTNTLVYIFYKQEHSPVQPVQPFKIRKLTLIHYCHLILRSHLSFTNCPNNTFL